MNTNKTLAQQVNEIKNARMSAVKKAIALVKLGLTKDEAEWIAKASMPAPAPRAPRFAFTFGVEIECVGCRFHEFRSAAQNNGLSVYDQFYYNHHDMPMYKLTTDSSVRGENPAECVTPALNGNPNGFRSLEACCKSLAEIGASANRSCGLHVHIGAANLSDREYCNVFVNYMRLESAIESFLAPSRRGRYAQWCASLRNYEDRVLNASTKAEMRTALHGDRYHRVNPCAYDAHKTIEFRQHQGSTNFAKISAWVKFLGKLVKYSKTDRLAENIDRIEDIPFLTQAEKRFFIRRRAEFEARQAI